MRSGSQKKNIPRYSAIGCSPRTGASRSSLRCGLLNLELHILKGCTLKTFHGSCSRKISKCSWNAESTENIRARSVVLKGLAPLHGIEQAAARFRIGRCGPMSQAAGASPAWRVAVLRAAYLSRECCRCGEALGIPPQGVRRRIAGYSAMRFAERHFQQGGLPRGTFCNAICREALSARRLAERHFL